MRVKMKIKRLVFILWLIPAFLYSQEKVNLDVKSAVDSAIKNNIPLKQEEIQLKENERKYEHSWNSFLPSITAKANVNNNGNLSDLTDNKSSFDTGISANLNINAGLSQKLESLKLSFENGKVSYSNAVTQLENEVTSAFYSLLLLKNQVNICEESVKAYKAQYEQTKTKKEKGLAPELDLLSSQLNYETSKIDLRNAEKSYNNSLNEFLNTIGISLGQNEEVELSGSLDDCFALIEKIDTNVNIEELVNKNSSIVLLENNLKQTKLNRQQLYNSTYFPSLNLSANVNPYSYSWGNGSSLEGNKSWTLTAGLSFSLDSLIPGSSAKDNILDLDDSIESLKLQIEEEKSKLKLQISQMLKEIELGKETLENCRLNVELAQKSCQMAEIAYKNGTRDLLSLQNLQSSLSSAQSQYMNQQLNLIKVLLNYQSLIKQEA